MTQSNLAFGEKNVINRCANIRLLLNKKSHSGGSHFLIGNGGCRGEDWDSGDWPKAIKGDKSLDDCSHECLVDAKCTGFHLVKAKGGKQVWPVTIFLSFALQW